MPTWVLRRRQGQLRERMDDPSCDVTKLEATYRQFPLVNRWLAGWRRIYARWLKPELRAGARSLLDVGCGGGDLLRLLGSWAERDGFALELTGIDPDARAIAFARRAPGSSRVRFLRCDSGELRSSGARFDLVVSNHLLHHLPSEGLAGLCQDSERLARRLALHNDLRRSDLAYLAFALGRPLFPGSFITPDGLTSIRRSFTPAELHALAPAGWGLERLAPYRLLLYHRPAP